MLKRLGSSQNGGAVFWTDWGKKRRLCPQKVTKGLKNLRQRKGSGINQYNPATELLEMLECVCEVIARELPENTVLGRGAVVDGPGHLQQDFKTWVCSEPDQG